MNIPTLILIVVIYIIGLLFVVKWIYDDAKTRGMNPWGWIIVTGLLSPNFIGLIAYLVFRRKDTEVACSSCKRDINKSMNYCYWCGAENDMRERSLSIKPTDRGLIIGLIIMVMSILHLLMIVFTEVK